MDRIKSICIEEELCQSHDGSLEQILKQMLSYKKVFIIYAFVGYLLVRYIRKGWIRFNPDRMIQCRLRDMLKKRKRIVDFLINLIVISNMIFVSCSFGLSALMDIPIVVSKGCLLYTSPSPRD